MKILLITYEYPPFHGGVSEYLSTLMKAAPATVAAFVDQPPKGEHWVRSFFRLLRLERKERFDLILVSHVLPAGYIAWLIKFLTNTPYIVLTHGTDILSARASKWKRSWMRFVLGQAKMVIANSKFTAGLLREEEMKSVFIIPPSLKLEDHPMILDKQPTREILSVGRLIERKGFDTMIRALATVRKKYPDAHYSVIGEGVDLGRLEKLANELDVASAVSFLGRVEDKSRYFRSAAVFAAPIRRVKNDIEGFGIGIIEASANGLPVVVGKAGGAPETVRDGLTGFIIAPEDVDALANAVIRLFDDPAEAAKMGAAGRAFVAREYSSPVVTKNFWELLHA